MKCLKAQELFSSYLENRIESPLRVAFEQHLSECECCNAAYSRYHATVVMLDEVPEVEAPPHLHAAIMSRLEQARRATPQPVRWWHIDWHAALGTRMSVRAVAAGMAALLLFAVLFQLTSGHGTLANLFGLLPDRQSTLPQDESVRGVRPWSPSQQADVAFAGMPGLSIGVKVDATSSDHSVYTLQVQANAKGQVPIDIRMISEATLAPGSALGSGDKICGKAVDADNDVIVPVVVTRSDAAREALATRIAWKHGGRASSVLVFLPSQFDAAAADRKADLSFRDTSMYDVLRGISAEYGIVVAAPSSVAGKPVSFSVDSGDAHSAMDEAMSSANLEWTELAPSIYAAQMEP